MGNDIVDLGTRFARAKAADPRFIGRVCVAEERLALNAASDPVSFFWAIWACKESAYKAFRKSNDRVSSAPRRYYVNLRENGPALLIGTVDGPSGEIPITVQSTPSYLHAVGALDRADQPIISGIEPLAERVESNPDMGGNPSRAVRAAVICSISQQWEIAPGAIEIVRSPIGGRLGPPVVHIHGRPVDLDISLSHDGRYIAWSYCPGVSPLFH